MRWRLLVVTAAVAVAAYGVVGMDRAPAEHSTGPCRSLARPDLPRFVPAALGAVPGMPPYTDVRAPTPAQLAGLYPVFGGAHPTSTVCLVSRGGHDQLMVVTEHLELKYYGPAPDRSVHDGTCVEFVDAATLDRHATRCS